jgi:toxin ParE1/3/4
MGRVNRNQGAQRDLRGIVSYIAEHNESAAVRWLSEMERAFQLLADHPLAAEELQTLRLGVIRRHTVGEYVIYYRPYRYGIRVVRVLHGARDQGRLI